MNAQNSAKKIAHGGMMVVLILLALYSTTLLPFNKLFLLGLSSLFIAISVIHYGKKQAFLVYMASSLLSLMLIPNKGIGLAYLLFFGYYGILKSLIEGFHNLFIEWILKLVCFNSAIVGIYLLTSKLFLTEIASSLPLEILILVMEVLFILYDYVFSLAIQFYNRRKRY